MGSLNTGTSRLVLRGHAQAVATSAVRSVLVAPVMETDKIRNKIRTSTVGLRLVPFFFFVFFSFSSKYGSHRDELDVKWRVEMVVLRGGAGMLHEDCTTTVKAVADAVCVF